MYNTIKKLNFDTIYVILNTGCETQEQEDEAYKLCKQIESSQEFKNLFFFYNENGSHYFYEAKDEEKILDFLSKFIDVNKISDAITEYGEELLRYECDNDDVEFNTDGAGKIEIPIENIYGILRDYLREDKYIKRLVNTKDFYNEIELIKKECLKYLVLAVIDNVDNELSIFKG